MMAYDWMIDTADMMSDTEVIGAFADYHIVLANCVSESSDDMMDSETMSCGDDVLKLTIAEATTPGANIMFHDADSSGTITAGDMIHINPDIDAGGEWNTVRLYSVDADKYSDENPMMTPGFGAFAGIVALLGAALLTRRD
jgi:PGF-CTERM protein